MRRKLANVKNLEKGGVTERLPPQLSGSPGAETHVYTGIWDRFCYASFSPLKMSFLVRHMNAISKPPISRFGKPRKNYFALVTIARF